MKSEQNERPETAKNRRVKLKVVNEEDSDGRTYGTGYARGRAK